MKPDAIIAQKKRKREHSSVGSERLPYKQRVGGSTPSAPTKRKTPLQQSAEAFFVIGTSFSRGPNLWYNWAGWTFGRIKSL